MKWFLIIVLFLAFDAAFAQKLDSSFVFTGYVFDEDSIAVENAYLINYRSLRAFAVDEHGRFYVKAQVGDSIKINHISFKQKVIYANLMPDSCNVFHLEFEPYVVADVSVKNRDIALENFNRNMALIFDQMKLNPPIKYQRGNVANPYSPTAQCIGFGFDLNEIIKLFKRKR